MNKIEKIEENNNMEIIYWDVKYGIPFVSNRDYVYCRESKGKISNLTKMLGFINLLTFFKMLFFIRN